MSRSFTKAVAGASAAVLLIVALLLSKNFQSNTSNPASESGKEKIVFNLNWYAQAELGGFLQAAEEGYFKEAGLDVEIRQGNAQINGPALLVSGGADFYVGSGFEAVKAVEQGIPVVTVAALFQKDPQVLISHPGVGNDKLEDLKDKPIMVSATATTSYWPFLAGKFGFSENQKRPYAFNVAPFLADPKAIQQGYGTSEPFTIEKALGKKPNVFYLADHGYLPYANTIETTVENAEKRPEMVRKFVAAVVKGWASYLQNPTPGFAAIKRLNPEMNDDLMNYGLQQMKDMGLVDSGDAKTLGIGAMTHERWKAFHASLVEGKLFAQDLQIEKAYRLDFLPKKVN
ncbi:MAG: ABC transporter substrate-binding protein [Silvanigrellaceae bacterium]